MLLFVATYKKWRGKFNYQVLKGAVSIGIYVPVKSKPVFREKITVEMFRSISFTYVKTLFSISSTNMPEKDRPQFL